MSRNHFLFFYMGGDDPRILDLPMILNLPPAPNQGSKERTDAFGKKIKACGVLLAPDLADSGEANKRLHDWLDSHKDVIQSFDVPYKWIRVLSRTDKEIGFSASPSLMRKLIDLGLTLEVLVVTGEQ